MFSKYVINFPHNIFEELLKSTKFEDIVGGRQGSILVDCKDGLIPIVRTTTVHDKPTRFLPIHYDIIDNIKKTSKHPQLEFNNALIEIYDSKYRNMKYHSDHSLDLLEDSYICVFSCYDDPSPMDVRKLKIKEKATGKCSEVLLEHNSAVMFSVSTNGQYLHKIVLETNKKNKRWLGITFRLSKTFIKFVNEIPYFHPSGLLLRIANEEERKEFLKHKRLENTNIGYKYPEIDYTISAGDTVEC